MGVLYPLSGPTAQAGVDARWRRSWQRDHQRQRDLAPPLARTEWLPGLGGAKLRLVAVDHQAEARARPARRSARAPRRTPSRSTAYHSSVSATASQVCERYGVPYLGESSPRASPARPWFFAVPHGEHFSLAMFEFLGVPGRAAA